MKKPLPHHVRPRTLVAAHLIAIVGGTEFFPGGIQGDEKDVIKKMK